MNALEIIQPEKRMSISAAIVFGAVLSCCPSALALSNQPGSAANCARSAENAELAAACSTAPLQDSSPCHHEISPANRFYDFSPGSLAQ